MTTLAWLTDDHFQKKQVRILNRIESEQDVNVQGQDLTCLTDNLEADLKANMTATAVGGESGKKSWVPFRLKKTDFGLRGF